LIQIKARARSFSDELARPGPMNMRRTTNFLLLAVSASGQVTGIVARLGGEPNWAGWIWVATSAPVLLAVVVGIGRAVLRREAGLDLIALLSMGGAIALGEYLTGAVIALMLAKRPQPRRLRRGTRPA
jgi:hypothetical protein